MVTQKEARLLYSIIAISKSLQFHAKYLIDLKGVHYITKDILKRFMNNIARFNDDLTKGVSERDKETWAKEWERDYTSATNLLTIWTNISDDKRDALEEFASNLEKGAIVTEPDYINPTHSLPNEGDNVTLIDTFRLHHAAVFKNGKFQIKNTIYKLDVTNVLLWKPDNTEEIIKRFYKNESTPVSGKR